MKYFKALIKCVGFLIAFPVVALAILVFFCIGGFFALIDLSLGVGSLPNKLVDCAYWPFDLVSWWFDW